MGVCRRDDPLLLAVSEMVGLYQWRRFRPELLARSLLAGKDWHELSGVLARVPGARVGRWDEWEPADRDDPRMAVLVAFLASHRWTELSLTTLCAHLLALLDNGS
jgi:hypothetical protein